MTYNKFIKLRTRWLFLRARLSYLLINSVFTPVNYIGIGALVTKINGLGQRIARRHNASGTITDRQIGGN